MHVARVMQLCEIGGLCTGPLVKGSLYNRGICCVKDGMVPTLGGTDAHNLVPRALKQEV